LPSAQLTRRVRSVAGQLLLLAAMAVWTAPGLSCADRVGSPALAAGKPASTPTPEPAPAQSPNVPSKPEAKLYVELAREKEEAGEHAAAADLMIRAAQTYPPVADGALDEAARLRMAARDPLGAIAALNALRERFPHSAAAREVAARLAAAWERQGDWRTADAMHQAAAAAAATPAARTAHLARAAACRRSLGAAAGGLELLEQALREPPNRATTRALRLRMEWLAPGDPLRQAQMAADFGGRCFEQQAYAQAGPALDDAVQLRAKAGQSCSPDDELFRRAGLSLFNTHRNEQALAYYRQTAALSGGPLLCDLAKLYTRTGDPVGARQTFSRILGDPAARCQRTAAYQLAWLNIEDKQYGPAYEYFAQRAKATAGRNELVRWLAAWTAYRAGRTSTALAHLNAAVQIRRAKETARAEYWQGRILLESGNRKAALKQLQTLNRRAPADYYGWQAGELLRDHKADFVSLRAAYGRRNARGRPLEKAANGWWIEYDELRDKLGHVVELTDVGLWRAAGDELDGVETPKKITAAHLWELARLRHAAGRDDFSRVPAIRERLYDYLADADRPLVETYYRVLSPLGYEALVRRYAARFGVPPALPFAVILHESGYRPHAVSPAYAVGLMQLLPHTAAAVAEALGEEFNEDSLYDPEMNIRYGCWYLRRLLDELGGEPAYAIAAYNAGPKAVAKWLRNKPGSPEAIFTAEVPYQETNRYVRLVLTSMKKYEALLQELEALR
jgi:tetratricopeptide (TPR) repeat protein